MCMLSAASAHLPWKPTGDNQSMNRLLPSPPTLLRLRALLRPPHGATPTGRGYSTAAPSPLRLAVIGAGPAGFYTSYRVLGQLSNAHVDMYESLPVPYGLVRYGVAPEIGRAHV